MNKLKIKKPTDLVIYKTSQIKAIDKLRAEGGYSTVQGIMRALNYNLSGSLTFNYNIPLTEDEIRHGIYTYGLKALPLKHHFNNVATGEIFADIDLIEIIDELVKSKLVNIKDKLIDDKEDNVSTMMGQVRKDIEEIKLLKSI